MILEKITVIGGGNLGSAFAEGLLLDGISGKHITITRRKLNLLAHLAEKGCTITDNNQEAVQGADVVVLAIKPWQILEVIDEIKPHLKNGAIIASFVSGVTIETIQEKLSDFEVYRVMPNTALEVQESMTLISTDGKEAHKAFISELFSSLGKVMFISDNLMDSATVLGACGIAYALRFVRAMTQGGIQIGFKSQDALEIATQTLKGAMELVQRNESHPEEEIDKVTTPMGCTIAGLNEMELNGFSAAAIRGILKSHEALQG